MNRRQLLYLDAGINLGLGALLLVYPMRLVIALGMPVTEEPFYASILGAVLLGVGGALWVEGKVGGGKVRGLGLLGAVCINLCGGLALLGWLLSGQLALPLRGYCILWALVVILLVLSSVELYRHIGCARERQ